MLHMPIVPFINSKLNHEFPRGKLRHALMVHKEKTLL